MAKWEWFYEGGNLATDEHAGYAIGLFWLGGWCIAGLLIVGPWYDRRDGFNRFPWQFGVVLFNRAVGIWLPSSGGDDG